MKYLAPISDLDGTILPRGGTISPGIQDAFRRAGNAGLVRVIATGRNLHSALDALPADFPIDYLVFSSGAGILRWHDKELLFASHLAEEQARQIAATLWDFNINFTVQREIPDNHRFYYTAFYPQHADYLRRIEYYAPFGTSIDAPEDIQGEATQFVMILDERQLCDLEEVRARLEGYSVVRSTSPLDNRAVWLEIFAPGIHKGATCRRLLDSLGIRPRRCIGIGNDYNDVDFLNMCGRAFVVANAADRLVRIYPTVASDRDGGFIELVDFLLGN